jgi:hypothetical protein
MVTGSRKESRGSIRRRELFELFSQNLDYVKRHPKIKVEPDFDEGFICPICFKLFDREALSTEYDDHLTLEDVPPQALGGKVLTLTCKICNNQAGAELESHLRKKFHSDAILAGVSDVGLDARFRPDPEVDLTAMVYIRPNRGIAIEYDLNRSDPKDVNRLHELEKSGNISEINIQLLLGYKGRRPEVALLRVAYLIAFSYFGYGFLINNHLAHIRRQIQNPLAKILPDWGIMRSDLPDSILGVSIICEPKDLQSFLVVFDLKAEGQSGRYGVVLPGPTDPGFKVYERIAELRKAKTPIQHRVQIIPKDDFLSNPELAFVSHDYWKAVCE